MPLLGTPTEHDFPEHTVCQAWCWSRGAGGQVTRPPRPLGKVTSNEEAPAALTEHPHPSRERWPSLELVPKHIATLRLLIIMPTGPAPLRGRAAVAPLHHIHRGFLQSTLLGPTYSDSREARNVPFTKICRRLHARSLEKPHCHVILCSLFCPSPRGPRELCEPGAHSLCTRGCSRPST